MRKVQRYHLSYILFLNLAIISLVLFILNQFEIIQLPQFLSETWLFSGIILFTTISILSKYNSLLYQNKSSRLINDIFQTAPYFFLSILVILTINQFAKLDFILERNIHLSVLAIAFGFMAFYKNRGRVEKELEDEKQKETVAEYQRYNEFPHKFRRINRIWGLRSIVRWMYKEGWGYSGSLILIIIISAAFIFKGLGNYGFQGDEIFHALSASNMLTHPFQIEEGIYYFRGLVVSLLALLSSKILFFLTPETSYRLPIALLGIANIFLIYILSGFVIKEKMLIILVTLLFALDPLFIIFSRYLRFYTLAITIILIAFIYLYKKDFSEKSLKIISLVFLGCGLIINEFFIILGFISLTLFFVKNYNSKNLYSYLPLLIAAIIVSLTFFYLTSLVSANFLKNILSIQLKSDFINAHFNWVLSEYPLLAISCLLAPVAYFSRKGRDISYFLFLSSMVIFFIIDLTSFNFTNRVFLFLIPLFLVYSSWLFLNSGIKKIYIIILLVTLIFTSIIPGLDIPDDYGERLPENKYFYEKQPIIIDTKTPILFAKDYVQNNSESYVTIYVGLNDLYFDYYFGRPPDYLSRWEGSAKDNSSFIETPMIFNLADLKEIINQELNNNKTVIVVTSATIYPIPNELYGLLFGQKIALEAPQNIGDYLESTNFLIYTGKDEYSKVYLFKKE